MSTSALLTEKLATQIRFAQISQVLLGATAKSASPLIPSPTLARISTNVKSITTNAWKPNDVTTRLEATAASERRAVEQDTLLMRKRKIAKVKNEKPNLLSNFPG